MRVVCFVTVRARHSFAGDILSIVTARVAVCAGSARCACVASWKSGNLAHHAAHAAADTCTVCFTSSASCGLILMRHQRGHVLSCCEKKKKKKFQTAGTNARRGKTRAGTYPAAFSKPAKARLRVINAFGGVGISFGSRLEGRHAHLCMAIVASSKIARIIDGITRHRCASAGIAQRASASRWTGERVIRRIERHLSRAFFFFFFLARAGVRRR